MAIELNAKKRELHLLFLVFLVWKSFDWYDYVIILKRLAVVSTSLLEIVDLGNGEIVLQRADESSDPLVTIKFSEESQVYLLDNGLEVAKVMLQAGIQAAATLVQDAEDTKEADSELPRTIH